LSGISPRAGGFLAARIVTRPASGKHAAMIPVIL